MKFKEIDKEFQLSDSSVNCYGFRLLTTGYQLSSFSCNPVGYYMHERDKGVLLKWTNLRVEGDKVLGKPCINLSHPRGQQTVDEIENSFLNAASMGHFVVLESSEDPKLKLPGQTGPTITKWYNRETSVVDIPGNYGSLSLFDKKGDEINLAAFTKPTLLNMKTIALSAAMLTALNLKADSPDADATTALDNLAAEAAKVPKLVSDLAAATTAKTTAETALQSLKAETGKKQIADLLATGLAAGKFTKEAGEKLAKKFEGDVEGLKDLVDAMPAYKSLTSQINTNGGQPNDLAAKSWDELDAIDGALQNLKAKDLDMFKVKYQAKFGTEYKG